MSKANVMLINYSKAEYMGIVYSLIRDKDNGLYIIAPCIICNQPKKIFLRNLIDICFKCSNKSKSRAIKISISKTGVPKTEEEKEKIRQTLKGRPRSLESIAKGALAQKGQIPWNKGKELSKEDKLHKSTAQKIAQPKYAQAQKERWENLSREEKEKRISKSLSASSSRPNVPETKVLALLDYICPGEYKYTGNGEITIGHMCPDFTNINGQKKVIEHFGDYWHRGKNPQEIIDKYLAYGFRCLVIWESELVESKLKKTMGRIEEFNKV